jgi:hypothetical protein
MPTVSWTDTLLRVLEDCTPGASLEAQVENLTRESLEHQLHAGKEALSRFEAKYGWIFADFVAAWQGDTISHTHSHAVERDFMRC